MNYTEDEKKLLNEAPDYDNQIRILEEEHKENLKKRKFIGVICGLLIGIATLFYVAYATIYVYRPYGSISSDVCKMVNLKVGESPIPNLNITDGDDCVPVYNVDYYLNGRPTFNIDLYGDRSTIYNPINQMDETNSYCVMNCDSNKDGWPDYNIDLDGDGKADINIINDPKTKKTGCDINCDINKDTLPETNIDTNNDGKADVNIAGDDYTKPLYNIDYMNNLTPTFNIKDGDKIINPINDATDKKTCTVNCDIDGDGWPEYNIDLDGDGKDLLNELIKTGTKDSDYVNNKDKDWKCILSKSLDGCNVSSKTNDNVYINIDTDGDGKADINISNDGGKTIENELNKEVKIDGKTWVLNKDINDDGFPDFNIDTDNDGKPDLNITDNKKDVCIKNCDTNNDGIPDYLNEINTDTKHKVSITNLNIDIDFDGVCDINCDLDGDLTPDINVDTNNDLIPDINIDYDHDNKPDYNIDTTGDGKPNEKIDAYGIGVCNFNCNETNPVNTGNNCTKNCDTNHDGLPDKFVDIDNDGKCDLNCGNGDKKEDLNNDYYLDSEQNHSALLDVTHNGANSIYITNPVDIKAVDIEPGWDGKYVLTIKNNSYYAVKYRIYWSKVKNEFTSANNLDYYITRDKSTYILDSKAPTGNILLKDDVLIKSQASIQYVMRVQFKETGVNQNVDAGKAYYGQLKVEVIK